MKKIYFIPIISALIYILGSLSITKPLNSIETKSENAFLVHQFLNPFDSSLIFPSSGNCAGCHDGDEEGIANVDADGNDVNLFDQWEASMMGQAAKDPYWLAKVKHETTTFPAHANAIENKCISCHAPNGHYNAILRGQESYAMEELLSDTLGLDGVSCGTCHQISRQNLGKTFSGEITFDTNRVIYGPYPFPFDGPMREFVGFTPKFSEHISSSEVCAPCHTLITNAFDDDGQPTEEMFIEQATYHEWLNSIFPTINVSCQSCHMPYIKDSVIISSGYEDLEKRYPYALHTLSGANTMMLELMKYFKDSLDIDVPDSLFDKSIGATRTLLTGAVDLDIMDHWEENDSLVIAVRMINRAGHKFPSGYPSRRAWFEILVRTETGDTILHSGKMNQDYSLAFVNQPYEPHYDTIRNHDQVQILEGFMVDLNENFTTILDRGATYVKDNRLPPIGFRTTHQVYDTTFIAGKALIDPNFNKASGNEGSGTDDLFIKIPKPSTTIFAEVKLYYQSVPPEWVEELFELDTIAEIGKFKWMYDSIQPIPELVTQVSDTIDASTTSINHVISDRSEVQFFPNPIIAGQTLFLRYGPDFIPGHISMILIDSNGKQIMVEKDNKGSMLIPVDIAGGIYFVQVFSDKQYISTQKILIYPSD